MYGRLWQGSVEYSVYLSVCVCAATILCKYARVRGRSRNGVIGSSGSTREMLEKRLCAAVCGRGLVMRGRDVARAACGAGLEDSDPVGGGDVCRA